MYEVHAGDRDCYLIDGRLVPALAGGDTATGKNKTTTSTSYENPYAALLNQVMAGGLPSVAKGYMENVAIPTTMNQAVKMGLGRSGGALEAVANTAWKPGVDIMEAILGRPLQPTTRTETQKKTPGVFDWLGLATGGAKTGLDLWKNWPSSTPTPTDYSTFDNPWDYRGGG